MLHAGNTDTTLNPSHSRARFCGHLYYFLPSNVVLITPNELYGKGGTRDRKRKRQHVRQEKGNPQTLRSVVTKKRSTKNHPTSALALATSRDVNFVCVVYLARGVQLTAAGVTVRVNTTRAALQKNALISPQGKRPQ